MSIESRRIEYHISDSPLGRLLIGATSKGLCSLMWGDHDHELRQALARRFPGGTLSRGQETPESWCDPLNRYLGGEPVDLGFPLDVGGTPFQRRVWHRLRAIPIGSILSYSNLAKALGNPAATRAVAGACAANPVALVIPCHRVIRSDGGLGGYRWGLQRKRRLLSLEASMAEDGHWKLTAPARPERAGATLPNLIPESGPGQESGNP